jgi:hypothetical protein
VPAVPGFPGFPELPLPETEIDLNLFGATKIPGALKVMELARSIKVDLPFPLAPKGIYLL